jgi:hypothetical protein
MVGSYSNRQLRVSEAVDNRAVLIPQNWEGLDTPHLCSIASRLSGRQIRSKVSAVAVIRSELNRRN